MTEITKEQADLHVRERRPRMKHRTITIQSPVVGPTVGKLLLCDYCELPSDAPPLFLVYQINGHAHLQCFYCGTSFCQGDCDVKEINP